MRGNFAASSFLIANLTEPIINGAASLSLRSLNQDFKDLRMTRIYSSFSRHPSRQVPFAKVPWTREIIGILPGRFEKMLWTNDEVILAILESLKSWFRLLKDRLAAARRYVDELEKRG
jgi:hypothetical protein